jgi:hypothetical protein
MLVPTPRRSTARGDTFSESSIAESGPCSCHLDDDNLVANAGLILPETLTERLGLEALIDATVRLDGRVGGAAPGRKVLTLLNTMLTGGSHIDHADMLRAGTTESVVSRRVMAPSTLGTFLRSFTFGHVRQLEAVNDLARQRAGTAPGALVIDVDSTICEVTGKAKQGAGFGYTHKLGYHPLLATIAATARSCTADSVTVRQTFSAARNVSSTNSSLGPAAMT